MAAYHIPAEDFDLLALGALEPGELQAAEEHVRGCNQCLRDMAAAQARMAIFALSAPQKKPSSQIKEQLMARIAVTPQLASTQGPTVVAGSASTPRAVDLQAPGPYVEGRGAAPIRPPRKPAWTFAWTGLILGLATASILLWVGNARLGRETEILRQETAQLQQNTAQLQQEEDQNSTLLHLFTAHDTVQVALAPASGQNAGAARVEYNSHRGLLFYSGNLPAPPAGRNYQLWLVPVSGNPISAGVFTPNREGRATIVLPQLPAGVAAKAFAVTIEPAGGVPQPTGPRLQIGAVG